MSTSNKVLPLGIVAVEGPQSLRITTNGAPSGPIPTPFALPSWQPPEPKLPFSERPSWEPPGAFEDKLSVTEPATPSRGARELLLPKFFPWISSSQQIQPEEADKDEEQAAEPALKSSKHVVLPHSAFYLRWYISIVVVALLCAIFDPYNAAFVETGGMYPFYNFWAVTDYVATALFTADIVLKFFLAYQDEKNKCMVTDNRAIAWRYFTSKFWFELVVSIPIEPIVAGGLGITVRDTQQAKFVGLLRWLRIGRMYPIFEVFATIQHKHILPPVVLTLARNYTYLFYIVHWFACVLFFIARAGNFSDDTWFGRDEAQERLDSLEGWADYLYSFYFSIGVFTGFSNEVFYKNSPVEAIVLCIYFVVNVVAQAYILGTITVLLVKNDVESGEHRNAVVNLDKYLSEKDLPKSLQSAMHEHLELQSYSEKTADENILKHYPSTIKQKVLRHIYMDVLKGCYLLAGCTPQFLNLLLSVVRMELFMPNVTMTQEGDTVGDLLIIADGNVNVAQPSAGLLNPQDSAATIDPQGSGGALDIGFSLGSKTAFSLEPTSGPQLGTPGRERETPRDTIDPSNVKFTRFGAEALMSEGSKAYPDSGIVIGDGSAHGPDSSGKDAGKKWNFFGNEGSSKGRRVSTIGGDGSSHGGGSFQSTISRQQSFIQGLRSKAASLGASDVLGEIPFFSEGSYTNSARTSTVTRVLIVSQADFQRLAESNPKDVSRMFRNLVKRAEKKLKEVAWQAMDAGQLEPSLAHAFMHIAEGEDFDSLPSVQLEGIKRCLTPAQSIILENVNEARRMLKADIEKHQILRMNAYLNAAVSGDTQRLPALIGKGKEVSATDYDKRSALMLACRENQEEAVEMLLKAGADTSTVDSFGYTAMFEAARKGNDGCIDRMLKYNAKLGVEPRIIAPCIFQAITSKDLECLRRFIRVGADLDCTDLDGRTPLFLAASEGLLGVVTLLVEEGNATVDAVDSWGHTAEGDARLAGHHDVAQYLRKQVQGSDKWPLLAHKGSFHAKGAEEPKPQTTDEEMPHPLSDHPGQAARSCPSPPLAPFSQPAGSRPGSSMDHKRQDLLKSLRHNMPSRGGGSRLGTPSGGARPRPSMPPTSEEQQPRPVAIPHMASPDTAMGFYGPTAPTASEEQPRPISPSGLGGTESLMLTAPITTEEQPPPIPPASPTGPDSFPPGLAGPTSPNNPNPSEAIKPSEHPRPSSFADLAGSTKPQPSEPIVLPEQPPDISPGPMVFAEQPSPIAPASPPVPANPRPDVPIAFEEQVSSLAPPDLAGPGNPRPSDANLLAGKPRPSSFADIAGSTNPRLSEPAVLPEQFPAISPEPIVLAEQPPPTSPPGLAAPSVPTAPNAFQEQPGLIADPGLAGSATPQPSETIAPPIISPSRLGGPMNLRASEPIILTQQPPPTAPHPSFNPSEPITFRPPAPPISPPGLAASTSPRLQVPIAFAEQPPPTATASLGGLANLPSTRLRSASQLPADSTFGRADLLRPPGTSPAGWMAFDGADRPGSRPTQTPPTIGSFPGARAKEEVFEDKFGNSMVLPFVNPELQEQLQEQPLIDMAEESVHGPHHGGDAQPGQM